MSVSEQENIDKNIRREVGINALRKIGKIVAEEQKTDAEKENALRWIARYGWIILLGGILLLGYIMRLI
ncbi:MAG: hypothetical protein R8M11_03695 [Gallionella sp.]